MWEKECECCGRKFGTPDSYNEHKKECKPPPSPSSLIHICRATGQYYQPRARLPGHQKYELLGRPCKSLRTAMRRLATAMSSNDYKRGDVLLCADYYDPHPLYEMVKQ